MLCLFIVLSYISKVEGNLVWLSKTFILSRMLLSVISTLLYLHDIMLTSLASRVLRKPCICFFNDDFSILSHFILTEQLLVRVPQIGQPYNKIGSICLSNRDSASLTDTFWLVLIACLIAKDALCANVWSDRFLSYAWGPPRQDSLWQVH